MRKIIFAGVLLLSGTAFGNSTESVYKSDTILPPALKVQILKVLKAQCAAGIMDWGLSERSSSLVSTGHYITEFKSQYYYDGYHPSVQTIVVESDRSEASVRIVHGQCDDSGR